MDRQDINSPLVLFTAMSGAGGTTFMNFLEDEGYETIDALPLYLFWDCIHPKDATCRSDKPLALSIDNRNRGFSVSKTHAIVEQLRRQGKNVKYFFLTASNETLARRFHTARRLHPLSSTARRAVEDAIFLERKNLNSLLAVADAVLDSSSMTIPQFRQLVRAHLSHTAGKKSLIPLVQSFAYKNGVPMSADNIFDVRFFRNPYYTQSLRKFTGLNPNVALFITQDPRYSDFFQSLKAFLQTSLPGYEQEGRKYLTVAFGCTGGQHRSIFWAEQCGKMLGAMGYRPLIFHRELKPEEE